jgi:hypothetical protein
LGVGVAQVVDEFRATHSVHAPSFRGASRIAEQHFCAYRSGVPPLGWPAVLGFVDKRPQFFVRAPC